MIAEDGSESFEPPADQGLRLRLRAQVFLVQRGKEQWVVGISFAAGSAGTIYPEKFVREFRVPLAIELGHDRKVFRIRAAQIGVVADGRNAPDLVELAVGGGIAATCHGLVRARGCRHREENGPA